MSYRPPPGECTYDTDACSRRKGSDTVIPQKRQTICAFVLRALHTNIYIVRCTLYAVRCAFVPGEGKCWGPGMGLPVQDGIIPVSRDPFSRDHLDSLSSTTIDGSGVNSMPGTDVCSGSFPVTPYGKPAAQWDAYTSEVAEAEKPFEVLPQVA